MAVEGVALCLLLTAAAPPPDFARYGREAIDSLTTQFYRDGKWRWATNVETATNQDHGDDSLTSVLFLRWTLTRDPALPPLFRALFTNAPSYGPPCADRTCEDWSDYPLWDSIAASQTWRVTGDPAALARATEDFRHVSDADAYALGACPDILYQQPFGGPATYRLKTLETDANAVKAALLLHEATSDPATLADAAARYDAIRRHYLDHAVPLYSVYVFDDGKRCHQVPHRFYASVNGLMIQNGILLRRATGQARYETQAVATARAIGRLADARGVFADLQAENDVVVPLVEAMAQLAASSGPGRTIGHAWIVRNARAALGRRKADATYGRFFDGPVTETPTTSLQANGGYALAVAAASLAPDERPDPDLWARARRVEANAAVFPVRFAFTGRAVAALGAIGEPCCELGHARVLVDGRETFDRTGIWQGKSNTQLTLPGSVLFAWAWPAPGRHVVTILPAAANGKEGGAAIHVTGWLVAP